MENYISEVKKQITQEQTVIVIDNSDITKPCSPKMEAIVWLCEFSNQNLILVVVYGFGVQPMLLLTNLDVSEKKKLCMIATKVYLMRWRIEEYFKFKKQQFELEDLRVISLQSIRNLNLFATLATGYIGMITSENEDTIFMLELKECSKRIFDVPKFIFYALGYAIERVLARTHSGIKGFLLKKEASIIIHLVILSEQ